MQRIIYFLTKPRLLNLVKDEPENPQLKLVAIVLRIIIGFILAIWIGFFPLYLFVIYMLQNRFFSYDFFVEGIFGLQTFIIVAAIVFLFTSFYFYGFIIFLKLGIKKIKMGEKNSYRGITLTLLFISLVSHSLLIEFAFSHDIPSFIPLVLVISILVCSLFYSFAGNSLIVNLQNWKSPTIFVGLTIILPVYSMSSTADLVSIGLRNFNIGGGKNIIVTDENGQSVNGHLLLMTPKNSYIKAKDGKLIISPISEHSNVKIW